MPEPLVRVEDLRVELVSGAPVVDGVSFSLADGEVLGLVGESGSGKSTTALALLGYSLQGLKRPTGSVRVGGQELVGMREPDLRKLRGRLVSYVPQNPGSALNPSIRVGDYLSALVRLRSSKRDVAGDVTSILTRVHLPSDHDFQRRFPHQLSGGQQQRISIAAALVGQPRVVVLDEPTTGLDVVTQAEILGEIDRIRRELGIAMIYVSHDLAVVASIVDRVAVMYAGHFVEEGLRAEVFAGPKHPYTVGLIESLPDHAAPRRLRGIPGISGSVGARPPGCPFSPRCGLRVSECDNEIPKAVRLSATHTVRCREYRRVGSITFGAAREVRSPEQSEMPFLTVSSLRAVYRSRAGDHVAVDDVSFTMVRGETLAIVGESGSGKTTIASCVAGVTVPASGEVRFRGERLDNRVKKRTLEQRRAVQIVSQNPYDTLNPKRTVGQTIGRPAHFLRGVPHSQLDATVARLLEEVRLPTRTANRYPRQLSGGERQRVAIARALAASPELLICDEITSALDVSVQAVVLDLLFELQEQHGLALLFITHDLGVVASIADRVLVLRSGVLCDSGTMVEVMNSPRVEYTRQLLESAPRLTVGSNYVALGESEATPVESGALSRE